MNEKRRSLTILALALLAWLAPQGAPAPAHGASKGKGKSKSGAPVEEPVHAWARVAPVGGGLVLADSLPAKARKTLQALAAETCGTTAPKLAWARVATRLPHDALLVLFAAAPSEAPDEGSGAAAADLCVAYAAVDGSKPAAAASARLRAGAAAAGDAPSAGRWTLAYERDLDVDGVSDAVLRWVDDASGEAALVLATTSPPALTAVPLRGKGPSPDAHGTARSPVACFARVAGTAAPALLVHTHTEVPKASGAKGAAETIDTLRVLVREKSGWGAATVSAAVLARKPTLAAVTKVLEKLFPAAARTPAGGAGESAPAESAPESGPAGDPPRGLEDGAVCPAEGFVVPAAVLSADGRKGKGFVLLGAFATTTVGARAELGALGKAAAKSKIVELSAP